MAFKRQEGFEPGARVRYPGGPTGIVQATYFSEASPAVRVRWGTLDSRTFATKVRVADLEVDRRSFVSFEDCVERGLLRAG